MSHKIIQTLRELQKNPHVDQKLVKKFLKRLNSNSKHLKSHGVRDHFCVGILVLNTKERKVFLGHHKKSDHWMGPGGHMEEGESPKETGLRETWEEIGIKPKEIILFDITHFDDVGRQNCSDHYDFFHYIDLESTPNFKYDKNEFHEARWLTFDEALAKNLLALYRKSMVKLFERIEKGEV